MACGKPVLAFAGGGALETVVKGKTGDFFYEQTQESITAAIKSFNTANFQPQDCVNRSLEFDKSLFVDRIRALVTSVYVPSN